MKLEITVPGDIADYTEFVRDVAGAIEQGARQGQADNDTHWTVVG